MKPLWSLVTARFRLLLQYRTAALAGVATQLFFGFVMVSAMRAFYGAAGANEPMPLGQAVSYIWLGQAFFALLPWRGDADVLALVSSGGLAYELLRPVDLYSWWFARAVALRTASVVLRAIPLIVVAWLWLGLEAPPSAAAAWGWGVAMIGAVALVAAVTVLMNISLLWTLSGEGVQFILPVLVVALSGQLLPLPLYPDWAQALLMVLPFRGMLDTPLRLWLGHLEGGAAMWAIMHQWMWTIALVLLGRMLLARGLRRVVIQGG